MTKTEKDRRGSTGAVKLSLCGNAKQKTDQKDISPWVMITSPAPAKDMDVVCVWTCNTPLLPNQK